MFTFEHMHSTKTPLRFGLLAAALWLATIAPAIAQQYMELPPRTLMGNMRFQSNPGNVVELPELAAALSGVGVALDQMTKVGDSIYAVSPTDRVVATSALLTTSRTWTLPPASSVKAGHPILIVDLAGGVTASNTLVISRSGSDTISGGASVTISVTNGAFYLVSDGAGAWTAQFMSPSPGGTVTSATIAAGAGVTVTGTCTITTSGTCTVAINQTTATNALGADVLLNNTANYFDGPSMAQGTTGTWWASGTATLTDTGAAAQFHCKLWDGTTVIDSAAGASFTTGAVTSISLSGFLASPAANIRISCKDTSATTGKILFNLTGNSKDSSVSGHRIQ